MVIYEIFIYRNKSDVYTICQILLLFSIHIYILYIDIHIYNVYFQSFSNTYILLFVVGAICKYITV